MNLLTWPPMGAQESSATNIIDAVMETGKS